MTTPTPGDLSARLREFDAPTLHERWCSAFDQDCAGVMDHAACHRGGTYVCSGGALIEMEPADGPCPYLVGANA